MIDNDDYINDVMLRFSIEYILEINGLTGEDKKNCLEDLTNLFYRKLK
ncbi:MAG: hypothetical protein KUG81_03115 [Gammaproteobacteria bacterium]|nr:hypothetical protein [Gammaproteobacteria bacterium]